MKIVETTLLVYRPNRSPIKTDDTSYIFDNGMLPLKNGFSR